MAYNWTYETTVNDYDTYDYNQEFLDAYTGSIVDGVYRGAWNYPIIRFTNDITADSPAVNDGTFISGVAGYCYFAWRINGGYERITHDYLPLQNELFDFFRIAIYYDYPDYHSYYVYWEIQYPQYDSVGNVTWVETMPDYGSSIVIDIASPNEILVTFTSQSMYFNYTKSGAGQVNHLYDASSVDLLFYGGGMPNVLPWQVKIETFYDQRGIYGDGDPLDCLAVLAPAVPSLLSINIGTYPLTLAFSVLLIISLAITAFKFLRG